MGKESSTVFVGVAVYKDKRGDDYLCTLLIPGAKSTVMTAHERSDKISQWLVQLMARASWRKAVVALANKNAHCLGAAGQGARIRSELVSVKPGGTPAIPGTYTA